MKFVNKEVGLFSTVVQVFILFLEYLQTKRKKVTSVVAIFYFSHSQSP